jgi:transposase InsO family protein
VKPRQVNEVYQAAFAELSIPGHRMHFMLAVLDCFSRYLLVLRVYSEPTAQAMVEGLKEALNEARTMSHLEESRLISLVADCGPSIAPAELTRRISGMPLVLKPLTNRTFQSLAMIRRLTWTITDEETSLHSYPDPGEGQRSLERFRRTFNFERPHQALGYRVPADLFCRTSG